MSSNDEPAQRRHARARVAALALVASMWTVGLVAADESESVTSEPATESAPSAAPTEEHDGGLVRGASLIYGGAKTSHCFALRFLRDLERDSNIRAHPKLSPVRLDSPELFDFPFAVMTGDGSFELSAPERENLRAYLESGGFVISSASCSSSPWNDSFTAELRKVFPERKLRTLPGEHPVFHTIYDIRESSYKSGSDKLPVLKALEIDGKVVLIHSPDGLNDTDAEDIDPSCCCCGGNEVHEARRINANLLGYALVY